MGRKTKNPYLNSTGPKSAPLKNRPGGRKMSSARFAKRKTRTPRTKEKLWEGQKGDLHHASQRGEPHANQAGERDKKW